MYVKAVTLTVSMLAILFLSALHVMGSMNDIDARQVLSGMGSDPIIVSSDTTIEDMNI